MEDATHLGQYHSDYKKTRGEIWRYPTSLKFAFFFFFSNEYVFLIMGACPLTSSYSLIKIVSKELVCQIEMTEFLGQEIASAVEKEFNSLALKSGKPGVRSNGISEWSVLSGIVALEDGIITVLALSTGVKAMPNEVRKYSHGWIVQDCHAEILCLRLFNYLLLDQIKLIELGKDHSKLLERSTSMKYKLRDGVKLALYISEPPCGDASMSFLSEDKVAWEGPKPKKQKVVRGRAHFDLHGIVRTKPGRADSRPTYSKSCSDKLCMKQLTGVLNCVNSLLIEPIYLLYLVLRQDKFSRKDFDRCFKGRISESSLEIHPLTPLTYKESEYQYERNELSSPLPASLLYVVPSKTSQVIVNGVKNGAYIKNKPPKPSGASFICKRKLYEHACHLLPPFLSYEELKRSNKQRESIKASARNILGLWPESLPDSFPLSIQ